MMQTGWQTHFLFGYKRHTNFIAYFLRDNSITIRQGYLFLSSKSNYVLNDRLGGKCLISQSKERERSCYQDTCNRKDIG